MLKNNPENENRILNIIENVFHLSRDHITDISELKKGMTNRSYLFSVDRVKYILRIPGEGTDQLINRKGENASFRAISGLGICDEPVYFDEESGIKITKYLENVRSADPFNEEDCVLCMKKLRQFHEKNLTVPHEFDLFERIRYYESLRGGKESVYPDYEETKERVFSLESFIRRQEKRCCLTHVDAVPDNFLFYTQDGEKKLQITDWEYAGMQDPHLDIAMWAVYSFYDRDRIDHLTDLYFEGKCDERTRRKIYCYVAAAGLLWSNWCEYKADLGVKFGEYAEKQYDYARGFSRILSGKEQERL